MTIQQEIAEAVAVNAAGWTIVFNTASWGAYIAAPQNVVSLVVALTVVIYTILRAVHLVTHWNHRFRKND